MAKVEIYTTDYCPYCKKAKALLDKKGIEYEEIDISHDEPTMRAKLAQMTGGRSSVPQIFINGESIGGSDDLMELNSSGKLDEMLSK